MINQKIKRHKLKNIASFILGSRMSSSSPITLIKTATKLQSTQLLDPKNTDNKKMTSSRRLIILVVLCAVFVGFTYKPLPENFPQPWKYRLICFGADLLTLAVS